LEAFVFRVPVDPNAPTFDSTFKVGFWRWLGTSFSKAGAAERHEWRRRRDLAAKVAERNQRARLDARRAEAAARLQARRQQR
jgi:hypothetical protein